MMQSSKKLLTTILLLSLLTSTAVSCAEQADNRNPGSIVNAPFSLSAVHCINE